jgi:hypothetical protein
MTSAARLNHNRTVLESVEEAGMRRPWRPLVAAVLSVFVIPAIARAQTLIVRNAPANAPIEVTLNAAVVGKATGDAAGDARIPVTLLPTREELEVSVHLAVDSCGDLRRIVLAERTTVVPPPAVGCDRRDVPGTFVMRRITTLVIDVAKTEPAVLISQGPPPASWLRDDARMGRLIDATAPGLTLSGGVSFLGFRDIVGVNCGNVAPCKATDYRPSFSVGATYWLKRGLAADVVYMRSGGTTAAASDEDFRFDSEFETEVITIGSTFGVPVTKVRPYGRLAFAYHIAKNSVTQTLDDTTVTIDGVEVVIPSVTSTFIHRSGGWGVLGGAGIEFWWKPPFGIYVEAGLTKLMSKDLDGGQTEFDDRMTFLLAGGRIYLGRIFTGNFLR